ncbi:glycoside hydrolase family 97 protein [Haladaptatus halobius]|uniref:glycoside hydrolase family 97 protein n=1 Tax=Haladaptatus halobius TaxID=2884875 RepID=UPI001D0B0110|nr:glycoside hydrolase family 97 protein [Haladaptatus halobius]
MIAERELYGRDSTEDAAGDADLMRVESLDGSVVTEFRLTDEGRPSLVVCSVGTTVVERSPLGLRTFEESFVDSLSIKHQERRTVETKYETPTGKRRMHRSLANEATLTLVNTDDAVVRVDLRVSTDGVAYRYRLPGRSSVLVTGEESAFRLPEGARGWLMPFEKKHEDVWRSTAPTEADGQYSFPSLFEVDDRWVLLTEAGVDGRYVASRFETKTEESLFRVRFPDSENHRMTTETQDVSTTRPLATPWRVAIVGNLATVVESDLVTDVIDAPSYGNDPCRIADTSWIEPGRVAWSWWSDGGSPGDRETQREYVDYASERGWEYVLVDEGWEREWLSGLVEYANERDVDVLVWSRWSDLDTPAKRDVRLSRWKSWGVAGVKVDFMNSDTQEMMRFYDDLAAATADHELLLNVHGSITPKGLRRRWPHLLTYEGVFGAENYHPVPKTVPPEHNVILPFTRNVLGPMDYTPVTFSAETRTTTVGHELALSTVFETGLQHFADSVESYAARPLAEEFLEAVPVAWDETRFVGGYPGTEATVARRRGDSWFLGNITAGEPSTVDVVCDFLDENGTYRVEVFRDDDTGESLAYDERELSHEDVFSIDVPENGGFAAIFRLQG